MTKVFAIDPGYGVESPTAITGWNTHTDALFLAQLVSPGEMVGQHKRLRYIAHNIAIMMEPYIKKGETVTVAIESFVMRGKGGETLQRLIGAIKSWLPSNINIVMIEVPNTVVKMVVGGDGKSDKKQVAKGLLKYFRGNRPVCLLIEEWIRKERWDLSDSLAIGVAAVEHKSS